MPREARLESLSMKIIRCTFNFPVIIRLNLRQSFLSCKENPDEANDLFMKAAALVVASAVGMYISIYFTLMYYSLVSPDARLVPNVCRVDKSSCRRILNHRDARVLGIPNSLVGMLYYATVLIVSIVNPARGVLSLMTFASWCTVLAGLYLVHSLLFKVKTPCPLCFVSHGINLVIAVVLTTG
jgi:uncharacterized membrane protein